LRYLKIQLDVVVAIAIAIADSLFALGQ